MPPSPRRRPCGGKVGLDHLADRDDDRDVMNFARQSGSKWQCFGAFCAIRLSVRSPTITTRFTVIRVDYRRHFAVGFQPMPWQ